MSILIQNVQHEGEAVDVFIDGNIISSIVPVERDLPPSSQLWRTGRARSERARSTRSTYSFPSIEIFVARTSLSAQWQAGMPAPHDL